MTPDIKPRIPRPLTDAEKAKLKERNGGSATPEQLAKLEATFGKRAKLAERKAHAESARNNNGWTR